MARGRVAGTIIIIKKGADIMLILSISPMLLGGLITLIVIGIVLAIFFHKAHHTFHGDIRELFNSFLIFLGIVGLIVLVIWMASLL